MTKDQKEKLKKIIDYGPRSYGDDTDLWKPKRISEVISGEFYVSYNTHLESAEDPGYVKEWLKKNYPECVKEATILFQDESGVQSRPNVRRTWSPRSKRPALRVREKRDKISISSAVSADDALYFAIKEGSMNEDYILSFQDHLLSEIHGFLYIFWDNIMIHRSDKVKECLGTHNNRLITRRLPAYSPELNPDELVWNALKYQDLPNFSHESMDDLKNAVPSTMNNLKSNPERLRNIIRGSSLPLQPLTGKN